MLINSKWLESYHSKIQIANSQWFWSNENFDSDRMDYFPPQFHKPISPWYSPEFWGAPVSRLQSSVGGMILEWGDLKLSELFSKPNRDFLNFVEFSEFELIRFLCKSAKLSPNSDFHWFWEIWENFQYLNHFEFSVRLDGSWSPSTFVEGYCPIWIQSDQNRMIRSDRGSNYNFGAEFPILSGFLEFWNSENYKIPNF